MPVSFPALKTGAVAQYPSDRAVQASAQVFRFLDGSEQRFLAFGAPLHKWRIQLNLLDERELIALEQFFASQAGRSGSFTFTDPWDGTVYANCSFDEDAFASELIGPGRGTAQVVVKENR